jgi:hypothetical protein
VATVVAGGIAGGSLTFAATVTEVAGIGSITRAACGLRGNIGASVNFAIASCAARSLVPGRVSTTTTDCGFAAAIAAIARGFTNGITFRGGVVAFGSRWRLFAPAIGDANAGIAIVPRRS